ncbi:uncharacterized protein CTRU02_203484 [Colletotrichum truncatum]|uniref:Uncharacterized protein n=1 Tax=Colletotrichum truncatum TaxID=5467 RepID=A0ACC3Z9G4_COLTU|nr:uncharacterized protein CTRU02_05867 [Colletotrichum truncatum]KAF6793613.1 hypothetical protein CTRU02_05867 [Colletotrichum truncatum]
MLPAERVTYFGYYEGLDPKLLRLGSMVLDYANPRHKCPYYHGEVPNMFEPPVIATADERPYCSMSEKRTSSFGGDIGLGHLLLVESSRSKLSSRLVVGTQGSKVELINPLEFFSQMLQEDGVRKWLEVVLTVASGLQKTWKNAFASPKIWLLTGVYLIEDATCLAVSSKSSSAGLSTDVVIPDLAGIAALLNTNIHAKVSLTNDTEGYVETKILGRRVWAAQWQQISASYVLTQKQEWNVRSRGMRLKLLDRFSVGTERGEADKVEMVDLKLDLTFATENDSRCGDNGQDEKMWHQFEEEFNELMEELEE